MSVLGFWQSVGIMANGSFLIFWVFVVYFSANIHFCSFLYFWGWYGVGVLWVYCRYKGNIGEG